MIPEGEQFYKYLVLARDSILRELEAVPPEALNWPLGMPETNTLYASAFHAASSTNYWVVAYVGGGSMERDRLAEFRTSGDMASLKARWQQTLDQSRVVFERLSEGDYESLREVALGPSAQRWPVRECLLHVIEHANTHLGHIQLARQLWEQKGKQ